MNRDCAKLRLLAGPEFNALLADDAELKRLEDLKYDRTAEGQILLETLHACTLRIGALPVMPITAAKWSLLWLLESPFIIGGEVTETDISIALYIISAPDVREIDCALHEIPVAAHGYAAATGLSAEEAACEVVNMIRTTFRPLTMLPLDVESRGEPARYDAGWLTQITSIAAKESNERSEYAIHHIPLAAICFYYVNYRRRESSNPDVIRCRPDAELERRIEARVNELADAFLQNKSVEREE